MHKSQTIIRHDTIVSYAKYENEYEAVRLIEKDLGGRRLEGDIVALCGVAVTTHLDMFYPIAGEDSNFMVVEYDKETYDTIKEILAASNDKRTVARFGNVLGDTIFNTYPKKYDPTIAGVSLLHLDFTCTARGANSDDMYLDRFFHRLARWDYTADEFYMDVTTATRNAAGSNKELYDITIPREFSEHWDVTVLNSVDDDGNSKYVGSSVMNSWVFKCVRKVSRKNIFIDKRKYSIRQFLRPEDEERDRVIAETEAELVQLKRHRSRALYHNLTKH